MKPAWRVEAPYTRGIYMDVSDGSGRVPTVGDYILTVGKRGYGSAYLIHKVRKVSRRDPEAIPRFSMRVSHVDKKEVTAGVVEGQVFTLRWYPRTKA